MEINFSELLQTAENYQPLKDWGFALSAKHEGDPKSWLVYKSQWCKMKIYHRKDFHQWMREDSLTIYYGRVHALDDADIMEYEGQKYHCWLNSVDQKFIFKYLDGQSPEEAMQYAPRPQWLEDYLANVQDSKKAGDWELMYEKGNWDHYGLRLFELLDVRRPDLWDGYINFLKEYAKLKYAKDEEGAKKRRNTFTMPEIPLYQII